LSGPSGRFPGEEDRVLSTFALMIPDAFDSGREAALSQTL